VIDRFAKMESRSKDANSYQKTLQRDNISKGSGGSLFNRVTKVVKGGKKPVIRGDGSSGRRSPVQRMVGLWFRKGKERSASPRKGIDGRRLGSVKVEFDPESIPNLVVWDRFGRRAVLLKPVRKVTGVMCGWSGARGDDLGWCAECADQIDGTTNPHNVIKVHLTRSRN